MEPSCIICSGKGRVLVGMSYPPKKTISVKYEYDPCPGCTPPPHSYFAILAARTLREMHTARSSRAALAGEIATEAAE